MMRVVLIAVTMLLAGCLGGPDGPEAAQDAPDAPTGEDDASADAGGGADDASCEEGCGAQGDQDPVSIEESGTATTGYDETFTWTVDPGAAEAAVTFTVNGVEDTPAWVGAYGFELRGPEASNSKTCPRQGDVSAGVSPGEGADTLVDLHDLAPGEWSLRACIGESSIEYDITVTVTY